MESDLNATVSALPLGAHVIRIVLVNRDHSPLGVANSEAQLIVTVVAPTPPGGDGSTLLMVGVLAGVAGAAAAAALLVRRRNVAK